MNAVLRSAEFADAQRVAEVLIASRKAFLSFAPSAHADGEVQQWVRDILIPAGGMTVAVVDGSIVGVLAVSHEPGRSWIEQLYIHPTHVSRGIGAQLLAYAVATLPTPIRLYTFQQNTGARRFYERHGFAAIEFADGSGNTEKCPDVLYELAF